MIMNIFKQLWNQERGEWVRQMDKHLLGRFQFSDGYVEDVKTIERFNLLNKVPDVVLLPETIEVKITDITGKEVGDSITRDDIPKDITRNKCKWYLYDYRIGLNLARYGMNN